MLDDVETDDLLKELMSRAAHRMLVDEVADKERSDEVASKVCDLITKAGDAFVDGDLGHIPHQLRPVMVLVKVALHDFGHVCFDLGRQWGESVTTEVEHADR